MTWLDALTSNAEALDDFRAYLDQQTALAGQECLAATTVEGIRRLQGKADAMDTFRSLIHQAIHEDTSHGPTRDSRRAHRAA